jgi:hypothetical protein
LIKILPSLDLSEISAALAEKFLDIERDRKKLELSYGFLGELIQNERQLDILGTH